jgi:hypothetical protein
MAEIITRPGEALCIGMHIRSIETSHLVRLHASYTTQITEPRIGQYEIK